VKLWPQVQLHSRDSKSNTKAEQGRMGRHITQVFSPLPVSTHRLLDAWLKLAEWSTSIRSQTQSVHLAPIQTIWGPRTQTSFTPATDAYQSTELVLGNFARCLTTDDEFYRAASPTPHHMGWVKELLLSYAIYWGPFY